MIYVAASGMIGVLARYLTDKFLSQVFSSNFPISTFGINCLGSFLIGIIFVLSESSFLSKETSLTLSVGLLGGFTTFSAFSIQTFQLFERKQIGIALTYLIASPAFGALAAGAGIAITRYFVRSA